jgi:hypothetical protein
LVCSAGVLCCVVVVATLEASDSMEEDPLIVDSSDDESKVVKLSDTQKYAKYVLNFMASQGS